MPRLPRMKFQEEPCKRFDLEEGDHNPEEGDHNPAML